MRFDYETKQDDRECVAYIDGDGDLVIRGYNNVCLGGPNRSQIECTTIGWNPSEADHKFYPGDSITLTFE